MHKDERNYAHQSFVATPQLGKRAVRTGSCQGPATRKSKSPPFPSSVGSSYIVRMTCRTRRCRAQSNNSLLIIFVFNITICCTCNTCPRAVEQATQATTRENLSSGSPTNRVTNQSLRLNRLARKLKFCLQQV